MSSSEDKILEILATLSGQVQVLMERVTRVEESAERMECAIFRGNARPSITMQLEKLADRVTEMRDDVKGCENIRRAAAMAGTGTPSNPALAPVPTSPMSDQGSRSGLAPRTDLDKWKIAGVIALAGAGALNAFIEWFGKLLDAVLKGHG